MTIADILSAARDSRTGQEIDGLEKIRLAAAASLRRPSDPRCSKIINARQEATNPHAMDGILRIRLAAGRGRPAESSPMAKANRLLAGVGKALAGLRDDLADWPRRAAAARRDVAAVTEREAGRAAQRAASIERAQRARRSELNHSDAPFAYFAVRDQLAAELVSGQCGASPEAIVDRVADLAGLPPGTAAEWAESILVDVERHREHRKRRI